MKLLPGWDKRLQEAEAIADITSNSFALRKSPQFYARSVHFVDTLQAARALVEFAQQRSLSHIGIDTEFRYDRPGVFINKNNTVHDPKSIHPLLLSLALAEPAGEERGELYLFVVDLRRAELRPFIQELLRLPVCFVGHNLKVALASHGTL